MSTSWKNDDGLVINFGPDRDLERRPGVVNDNDPEITVEVAFEYDNLPRAVDGDGGILNLPAGAFITEAYIEIGTAWASGTSLSVGTEEQDGTAIDVDGIFNTTELAQANLTAGAVIKAAAGADIGTVVDASNNAYLAVIAAGTFTTGTAKLIVKYLRGV